MLEVAIGLSAEPEAPKASMLPLIMRVHKVLLYALLIEGSPTLPIPALHRSSLLFPKLALHGVSKWHKQTPSLHKKLKTMENSPMTPLTENHKKCQTFLKSCIYIYNWDYKLFKNFYTWNGWFEG